MTLSKKVPCARGALCLSGAGTTVESYGYLGDFYCTLCNEFLWESQHAFEAYCAASSDEERQSILQTWNRKEARIHGRPTVQ